MERVAYIDQDIKSDQWYHCNSLHSNPTWSTLKDGKSACWINQSHIPQYQRCYKILQIKVQNNNDAIRNWSSVSFSVKANAMQTYPACQTSWTSKALTSFAALVFAGLYTVAVRIHGYLQGEYHLLLAPLRRNIWARHINNHTRLPHRNFNYHLILLSLVRNKESETLLWLSCSSLSIIRHP